MTVLTNYQRNQLLDVLLDAGIAAAWHSDKMSFDEYRAGLGIPLEGDFTELLKEYNAKRISIFCADQGVIFLHATLPEITCIDSRAKELAHSLIGNPGASNLMSQALVRSGRGDSAKYYPVQLIFATQEDRALDSKKRGNALPPPERWVTKHRKAVLDLILADLSLDAVTRTLLKQEY